MKEPIKKEIFKVLIYYSALIIGIFAIIFFIWQIKKSDYIYKDNSLEVVEIRRFEFDKDTMIVLKISYRDIDYITTKIKSK